MSDSPLPPVFKSSGGNGGVGSRDGLLFLRLAGRTSKGRDEIYIRGGYSIEMHWSKDHPDYICAMSTAISTPSSRKRGFSTSCPSAMPDMKRKADDLSPADKAIAPKRTVATLLNPFPALGLETDEPWFTQLHETVQAHARSENAGDMSKKTLQLDVSWQPQSLCAVSLIFHL
jgi:hypothetical protein